MANRSLSTIPSLLLAAVTGLGAGSAGAADPATAPAGSTTAALPAGWVTIPSKGKTFTMGQEFSGKRWTYTFPAHPVSFTYDFAMSATQVTQAEYLAVAGTNPTLHPGDLRRPIDNVTWFDAVLYCNALSARDGLEPVYAWSGKKVDEQAKLTRLEGVTIDLRKPGYRLLTSAEYEFVTRAGTTTTWFFGDDQNQQDLMKGHAWCDRNAGPTTHPVGTKKANAFGVYDITGNLWMWCNDDYEDVPYPTELQIDPTGPKIGREKIARGGAFKNDVWHMRSAYHWQWWPDNRNFELGFRIARTLP